MKRIPTSNLLDAENTIYNPTKLMEKAIEIERDLYLSDLVDNQSALYICSALKIITSWQQEDTQTQIDALRQLIPQDSVGDLNYVIPSITMYINSCGGYLGATTAIINAIHETPFHVITVAAGDVFSAAAYIYAAADRRVASPLAMFMLHEPAYIQQGAIRQQKGRLAAIERQYGRWLDYFATRTNQPVEYWQEKLQEHGDYYLTADEALEVGLVDEIIEYKQSKTDMAEGSED